MFAAFCIVFLQIGTPMDPRVREGRRMVLVTPDSGTEPQKGGRTRRLGLKEVRALGPGAVAHDPSLPGFGARRREGETVSYFVLYYTADGRRRRFTIGQHGKPWTPDTARDKALEILSEVRLRGADPAATKKARRQAATVSELCDLYLEEAEAGRLLTRRGGTKKASTLATDRSRISAHIKPELGSMKVPAVQREDVEAFMHRVAEGATKARKASGKKRGLSNVRGGRGASSRTIGLLGAIFTFAVRQRMRPDNPVQGVLRHADGRRERRLADVEYAAFNRGLLKAAEPPPRKTPPKPSGGERQGMWPDALAAARFLLLTGWRSGEALSLRWEHLDLDRRTARLPDTKTGISIRPLSQKACELLEGQGVKSLAILTP
jgi:hypothetical protein